MNYANNLIIEKSKAKPIEVFFSDLVNLEQDSWNNGWNAGAEALMRHIFFNEEEDFGFVIEMILAKKNIDKAEVSKYVIKFNELVNKLREGINV